MTLQFWFQGLLSLPVLPDMRSSYNATTEFRAFQRKRGNDAFIPTNVNMKGRKKAGFKKKKINRRELYILDIISGNSLP